MRHSAGSRPARLRPRPSTGSRRTEDRDERTFNVARVKLPTILRSPPGGERAVDAEGTTLRELLEDLENKYPGITGMVLTDDGALHRFVNVYVNDEDVRYLGSLQPQVEPEDT